MLVRQWINFAQDGITTKVIPKNLAEEVVAYNNMFNHFNTSGHVGLLDDVSTTFIGTFFGTLIGTFKGTMLET